MAELDKLPLPYGLAYIYITVWYISYISETVPRYSSTAEDAAVLEGLVHLRTYAEGYEVLP